MNVYKESQYEKDYAKAIKAVSKLSKAKQSSTIIMKAEVPTLKKVNVVQTVMNALSHILLIEGCILNET